MKTLSTIILFTLLFTSMGYIVIEWNHDKFKQLCKKNPTIEQCEKEFGAQAL